MSRTVHHVTDKNRQSTRLEPDKPEGFYWRFTWPMAAHWIRALRYSSALVLEAERGGYRPQPARVARHLEAHTYPRSFGLARVGYAANRQERALRAADRVAARRVLELHRVDADAVWDLEFADPRHRHFAVWDAW